MRNARTVIDELCAARESSGRSGSAIGYKVIAISYAKPEVSLQKVEKRQRIAISHKLYAALAPVGFPGHNDSVN